MSHTGTPEGAAAAAVAALNRAQLHVAVAESLTGGLVCAALTSVPGASAVFVGGIVAYTVSVKQSPLGVPADLLAQHGPVHPQVARHMARGAADRLGAEIGASTTGVAGPEGHGGQPPGLAYIGWTTPEASGAIEVRTGGDRVAVRTVMTEATLQVITQCAENGAARSALLTGSANFTDRE